MNYSRIEELLLKYFDGDTSLKEEKELMQFFTGKNIPGHLRKYVAVFKTIDQAAKVELPDNEFDEKFLTSIETGSGNDRKIRWLSWYTVSAVAAAIILALVVFVPVNKIPVFNYFSNKIEDTFDNPADAYTVTVQALMSISSKLNAGTREMQNISLVNSQMEPVKKMKKINNSMVEMASIGKIDEGVKDMEMLGKINTGKNEVEKISKLTEN